MRFERSREIAVRYFRVGLICVAAFAPWQAAGAQLGCPASFLAYYEDPGLGMMFAGTTTLSEVRPDGTYVYYFRGVNFLNQMRVTGYHNVNASQCEAARFQLQMGWPAHILRFDPTRSFNPQFYSFSLLSCEMGGGEGKGHIGGGEETNRLTSPRLDVECDLPQIEAPSPLPDGSDGSGTATLVTITTCYYVAHFDGSGTYVYTEFLYCTSYSYIALQ
jgi:hypothetical protein